MAKVPAVKKPSAADRTLGMFSSGRAQFDTPKPVEPHSEDIPSEAGRLGESIEQAAERWRANAFFTQEHLSKHFNESLPGKEKYRLTCNDKWYYLEQFRLDGKGGAYHYCGLMFAEENLYELTGLLVKASRDKAEQ